MRTTTSFNEGWLFEGSLVTLPHSWNAEDGTKKGYRRGSFVYEKDFSREELPFSEGERLFLELPAAAMKAVVALNGRVISRHEGGYSLFRAELTDFLARENHLCITVSNEDDERIYPRRADFTFYGGLYRGARLITVPEEHFELLDSGTPGIRVLPRVELEKHRAVVTVETRQNAESVEITVNGETKTVPSVNGTARAEFVIENVHLWDGLNDPYLYTATARLASGDAVSARFGCREFHIDPDRGFFLNGRSYPLHGAARHQDREGCGNVLTDEMHREDLEILLSMGANAMRLAHYQHDQTVYELCDEMGILAWAEIPYITVHSPVGRENTLSQYRELIGQNINHPSIFCWAMSNEVTLEGVTDDLLENHRLLNELAHQLDPTRLTATANLFLLEPDSPMVDLPDITGYNLYYGWYVGEKEDNADWFDEFRRVHPHKGVALTEYGADAVLRLQSPLPERGDFSEGYQALYHEYMLELLEKRPYIWGSFVWNLFEFAAADRDDAGDPGKNHKGLVSFDRKTKKDAFYIYKAHWSTEPFVHLCGRRYVNRLEAVTEVKVYSNQPEVELWVDGKPFATQRGRHIFRFEVPLTGEHEIEARSGTLTDRMAIRKADAPDPSYFKNAESVRNWFDKEDETAEEGVFSLDSTFEEIQADPEGAALLNAMMSRMSGKIAGGIGAKAKIPPMMMKVIGKMTLRKLLSQSGLEIEPAVLAELDEGLRKIKKIKEKKTVPLPENFLLGAATAAHQVEGNNTHSDYWAMEQMKYSSFTEPSGAAVDHYHRYEEDIRLLAGAGLNAYRFSVEWARIEPEEGRFDEAEVEHYRRVLLCCRENGVTPVVTLHHFTSPAWLIKKGGWEAESTVGYFARYCRYVAEKLGDLMEYTVTINEANMGLQLSMIAKRYLKKMFSLKREKTDGKAQVGINLRQMLLNMKKGKAENREVFGVENPQTFVSQRTSAGDILVMRAHQAAKAALKEQCPHLKVGLSLSLHDVQVGPHGEKAAARAWEEEFLHYLPYIINDDFLGVQNYTRSVYGRRDVLEPTSDAELTQMDYEFYPEALEHVLRKVHESFSGELLVTENGIATQDDSRRVEFLKRALDGVRSVIADGLPVGGYFCWSLLDNFEWQKGFAMTFGMIAVDRTTMERHPKESLRYLGSQRGK